MFPVTDVVAGMVVPVDPSSPPQATRTPKRSKDCRRARILGCCHETRTPATRRAGTDPWKTVSARQKRSLLRSAASERRGEFASLRCHPPRAARWLRQRRRRRCTTNRPVRREPPASARQHDPGELGDCQWDSGLLRRAHQRERLHANDPRTPERGSIKVYTEGGVW